MFGRLFGKKKNQASSQPQSAEIPASRLVAAVKSTEAVQHDHNSNDHQPGLPRPEEAIFTSVEAMCADTWNRLRPETQANINETVDRLQTKWAAEEEDASKLLLTKRAYAKNEFGKSCPAATLMDRLIEFIPDGRYYHAESEKKIKAELRSIGSDARRQLFDFINALKIDRQWGDEPARELAKLSNNRTIDTKEFRFELIVETQLNFLLEIGFDIDSSIAEWSLDYLANGVTAYYLQLQDQLSRDYAKTNLGILKQIAREAKKGMQISADARANAVTIFDRYCNVKDGNQQSFFDSGKKMDKVCEALLEIGQVQKPNSLIEQHLNNMNCRALSPQPANSDEVNNYSELRLVFEEAWQLIEDIKRYKSDQTITEVCWLNDTMAFHQKFGLSEMPQSGGLCYGWWTHETMGKPGFAKVGSNTNFEQLENWFDYLLSSEELECIVGYLSGDISFFPFVYTRQGIPDIQALCFNGHDLAGKFVDHLISSGASKPSKKWLEDTSAFIEEIGSTNVFEGFQRWTSHLYDDKLDTFDWGLINVARRYKSLAEELQQEKEDWSGDSPLEFLYRQYAMKIIAKGGAQLANTKKHPDFKRNYTAPSEKSYANRATISGLSDINTAVMKGIIWASALLNPSCSTKYLEQLGTEMFRKRFGSFRSKKCGNGVLWALGEIGTMPAVNALARIRRSVKDKSIAKLVDSALTEAARQHNLTLEDMQELSMADYGIGSDGRRVERFGQFNVILEVVSSKKALLTTTDTSQTNVKPKRGISKAAQQQAENKDFIDELKVAADDISKLLPEAKSRIENSWRNDRFWSFADWQERFYENGLVATLSRRLIWTFDKGDGSKMHLIPTLEQSEFIDMLGNKISPDLSNSTVSLWHPLHVDAQEVAKWRTTLRQLQIRQPFMQAWRPIYLLTEAEQQTKTYSNRFSGHILHQPPVIAMLRKRGWTATSKILGDTKSDEKQNHITLPAFGVAAQYWASGIGDLAQQPTAQQAALNYGWANNFEYVSTDRLTFFEIDKTSGKLNSEPMRIEDVPPMALTEVMRDIDAVVGITSIGSDRFWNDRGEGAPPPVSSIPGANNYREEFRIEHRGELLKMRCAFLESMLPSLSIANQCSLTDKWLIVDGKINTYKIHLGSGNTLIAPNDQYLCIVENRIGDSVDNNYYLPFEGDSILSMTLSKAFMLADDDKISDPIIVSQINS